MRENRTPGSVRGLSGNWQSYRDYFHHYELGYHGGYLNFMHSYTQCPHISSILRSGQSSSVTIGCSSADVFRIIRADSTVYLKVLASLLLMNLKAGIYLKSPG
ncbi:MAG: hypothetical protein R6U51_08235 [Anaerolineales bacterium]